MSLCDVQSFHGILVQLLVPPDAAFYTYGLRRGHLVGLLKNALHENALADVGLVVDHRIGQRT